MQGILRKMQEHIRIELEVLVAQALLRGETRLEIVRDYGGLVRREVYSLGNIDGLHPVYRDWAIELVARHPEIARA